VSFGFSLLLDMLALAVEREVARKRLNGRPNLAMPIVLSLFLSTSRRHIAISIGVTIVTSTRL
jgi:hypothetical protein